MENVPLENVIELPWIFQRYAIVSQGVTDASLRYAEEEQGWEEMVYTELPNQHVHDTHYALNGLQVCGKKLIPTSFSMARFFFLVDSWGVRGLRLLQPSTASMWNSFRVAKAEQDLMTCPVEPSLFHGSHQEFEEIIILKVLVREKQTIRDS